MRLTALEKGFFDATPVKPNKLVDFGLSLSHRVQAAELADRFWKTYQSEPRKAQLFVAATHALFLGQYKQAQPVEEFLYLYTAIDACYRLTKELRSPNSRDEKHGRRINWMCCNLGVLTPSWACPDRRGRSEVSDIRNNTLHEALFLGEPLGYAGQWGGHSRKPHVRDESASLPLAGGADRRKGSGLLWIARRYCTATPAQIELENEPR